MTFRSDGMKRTGLAWRAAASIAWRVVALSSFLLPVVGCRRQASQGMPLGVGGPATTSGPSDATKPATPRATTRSVRDGGEHAPEPKPDGRIIRVPDNQTVIIDVGVGDRVSPGTTFEVYDSKTGVPAGGAARDGGTPRGKASIEVIRQLPGYSECRVFRREPGQAINVGDVVARGAR